MISLAITTYNRSGLTVESFINVLENDFIQEIVIVDDNSDIAIYNNLLRLVKRLNHVKIRVIRNRVNLGAFSNKKRAIASCKCEWVVLLDSDNVIDNDYIDIVKRLEQDKDMLYCPALLYDIKGTTVQWDYSELGGLIIEKNDVPDYIENVTFETCLNTGNNFFHRRSMLNALNYAEDDPQEISAADSTYTCYLWLLSGRKIQVVPNLGYGHRVHGDSWYISHVSEGLAFNAKLYQRMREFRPPKGGFVVNKEFKAMIRTSYDFNQRAYDADPRWSILEKLYVTNYQNAPDYHAEVLPKKIHQVWLGSPIPEKYKRLTDTWKELNPDWEYKLWTDEDVKDMDLPNRKLFDSMTNFGPKSDLLRYHILNEYGGIYADTDFECLRPFSDFCFLEFFTGIAYQSKLELYPGLIGCIPHHPIMEQIVKDLWNIKSIPDNPTGVLETISSYFFTREFWKVVTENDKALVAFPPDYFYPFPNQRGHQKRDGHVYIKDCSFALHHWAVSWLA